MRSAASPIAPHRRPDDGFMISETLIEQFQRDGAVCIPRLFTPAEMADLEAGIDMNLSRLSPRAKIASAPTDPGVSSRTSATGRTIRTIGESFSTRRWPRRPPA